MILKSDSVVGKVFSNITMKLLKNIIQMIEGCPQMSFLNIFEIMDFSNLVWS